MPNKNNNDALSLMLSFAKGLCYAVLCCSGLNECGGDKTRDESHLWCSDDNSRVVRNNVALSIGGGGLGFVDGALGNVFYGRF